MDRHSRLQVSGASLTLDGVPFEMWGIRVANALENDRTTYELIAQLDRYLEYGINTISVFLMGAWTGSANPFLCNGLFNHKLRGSLTYLGRGDTPGRAYQNSYLDRLAAIIEEAASRHMVVNLGIFYQMRIEQLEDNKAILLACRETAQWLLNKNYSNILMDLVNEYGHPGFINRSICYGIAYKGSPDGGSRLIQEFKSIHSHIPVSISTCGHDLEGEKILFLDFEGQDAVLIHYSVNPQDIYASVGRQLPVVCNEWGPGIALEPVNQLGQWLLSDRDKWEEAFRMIRGHGGYMFIFSHWKQLIGLDGPHFEPGPPGTQPNEVREGIPSDEWLFQLVKMWNSSK